MADPNTQIDWWIAQAWQEAQDGADNDSLVAWLHENGLTAISSHTILQAALSCPPEEAKEVVFGHPVWAGEDPGADVDSATYTTETLEPEPEPDPSFELDDWAEQVEEDEPVYGEDGYRVNPEAGAAPTDLEGSDAAYPEEGVPLEPQPAVEGATGPNPDDGPDRAAGFDADPAQPFAPEFQPSPMNEDGRAPELAEPFEADPEPAPVSEPPPLAFESETPAARVPDEPAAPAIDAPVAPMEMVPPQPPAAPPILRTPPSTPAERAAMFASAFGKKPAAAASARTVAEPDGPPPTPQGKKPPSGNMGSAAEADTAPAQSAPGQPQPAMATAQMPEPLVYEPLPDFQMPPPVAPAEALFAPAPHEPRPEPPQFPPDEVGEPAQEPVASVVAGDCGPDRGVEPAPNGLHAVAEPQPESQDDEPEPASEPAIEQTPDDLPAAMQGAIADDAVPPDNEVANDAPRPYKQVLLDPSAEAQGNGPGAGDPGETPLGETPESQAQAVKRLGIDFRGSDPMDAGMDPEMARTAKQLGISFRENGGAAEAELDEIALEAQRLGISFREGDSGSAAARKPLIVKYMPLLLGVVVIFFLLLLGANFAGPLTAWIKS